MSLTDENFDTEFGERTIDDSEFNETFDKAQNPFIKLQELIEQLNTLRGISLSGDMVDKYSHHIKPSAIINGKYSGLILTAENSKIIEIKTIIYVYGFKIEKFTFVEDDDNFTFLHITIK